MQRRAMRALIAACLLAVFVVSPEPVHGQTDSTVVAGVVHRFHGALASGDTASVIALLHDDVQVLEGGRLENRDQYIAGHMRADMAFATAVAREIENMEVYLASDVAWVVSTSTTSGEYRGRTIDARGAELIVLARENGEWRITAIHWSSRSAGGG